MSLIFYLNASFKQTRSILKCGIYLYFTYFRFTAMVAARDTRANRSAPT